MQLTITLSEPKITLPFASSHIYQGLIYNALTVDKGYASNVHDKGSLSFSSGERAYKLFTFGDAIGKRIVNVQQKTVTFLDELTFEIRSPDSYFIQLLIMFFSRNQNLKLGKNNVLLKDFNLTDKVITKDRIQIKTLSPISVHWTVDKKTVFFSPEEEKFYSMIITNAKRKWESYSGSSDGFYLNVLPTENREYKKVATRVKNLCTTGYHGSFILEGPPEILNFLYHAGLGAKNSYGFGMFEEI